MEDRKLAVKKYNEYRKKYNLPPLEELEDEFGFELDDDAGIAKTIINQIWERISALRSYIEGILNPQRYCCLIETKFFNPKEKEKIFKFYQKIMIAYWKTIQISFKGKEERFKHINFCYDFYKKVRAYSLKYTQRMIDGWSEEDKEEKESYID